MIDESRLIDNLKKEWEELCDYSENVETLLEYVIRFIGSQPKIGGWIPCSERLPKEDGFYLVTLTEKVTDINDIMVTKIFFSEKSNSFTGYGKSVIAWQPLPEAYHE